MITLGKRLFCNGLVLFAATLGVKALAAATDGPAVSITVRDLTAKFLTFYGEAAGANPDQRWRLWKRDYGFAAVPPTPEGDHIARQLLEGAWLKYPAVLPQLTHGASGIAPSPQATLERVAETLSPMKPVHLDLIVYVGAFEGNAFTVAPSPGKPTVAIPAEQSAYDRGPVMAHEFTHAVQISMGTMGGGWVRSVGETVLAEGLAMRVAQHLYPDRPALSFVEARPGWFVACEKKRGQILRDVRSALDSNSSDDVMRFTMGNGAAGVEREAYYAAWLVTDYWIKHKLSYAQIARIPEAEAPARVRAAIDALLEAK